MATDKFVDLVRRMRTAQKEYFKTRDHETLKVAKTLERRVDDWLKYGNQSMFDDTID